VVWVERLRFDRPSWFKATTASSVSVSFIKTRCFRDEPFTSNGRAIRYGHPEFYEFKAFKHESLYRQAVKTRQLCDFQGMKISISALNDRSLRNMETPGRMVDEDSLIQPVPRRSKIQG
jgi:hypothetical protein